MPLHIMLPMLDQYPAASTLLTNSYQTDIFIELATHRTPLLLRLRSSFHVRASQAVAPQSPTSDFTEQQEYVSEDAKANITQQNHMTTGNLNHDPDTMFKMLKNLQNHGI